MVKNYKCPDCGATLEYDPQSEKMHCAYCDNNYEPSEIGRQALSGAFDLCPEDARDSAREKPKLRMNIAVCNSCGAELAVNAVEVSSFCPYCGNASVVMDRVEDCLAPDYVIPFKVTPEEAEEYIRGSLQGRFVPDEIKNFELEQLRGVYIPFWLYDVYYGARQKWYYKVRVGKYSLPRYAYSLGDCVYHRLTLDASRKFNDSSSRRLEPFDMRELKPFDPVYLSGFYADRFDVGSEEADSIALSRAGKMFNKEMKDNVPNGSSIDEEKVKAAILKTDYAFLPVYFLTFRHKDVPYTILLNGQTKKMVGAVPTKKKTAWALFSALAILFSTIFTLLYLSAIQAIASEGTTSYRRNERNGYWLYFMAVMFIVTGTMALSWIGVIKKHRRLKKSVKLSRSITNNQLATERQEK